ncbi:MAG TPA: triose-phosphate isomerase [Planctomycetota bacterium]|nr:triose-phosphate isomerase [Planctomycetota bacterium]
MTHRTRKPYIAGNWKMNLDRARSLDLIKTVKGRLGDGGDREVAFFVPAIYLADVTAVAQGSPLGVGGQNIWYEANGAFTGELAARMLREVGADRVLIGHSERRHVFHEPDDWMGRKVRAALDQDLLPIYCIGETLDERKSNRTDRVIKRQLETGLDKLRPEDTHRLTIAYEPVWAIGTGETATSEQVAQAHRAIRKWLVQRVGEVPANAIRILYGGSVKPDNARELMGIDCVDGLLVGGASLQAETFLPIIEYDAR